MEKSKSINDYSASNNKEYNFSFNKHVEYDKRIVKKCVLLQQHRKETLATSTFVNSRSKPNNSNSRIRNQEEESFISVTPQNVKICVCANRLKGSIATHKSCKFTKELCLGILLLYYFLTNAILNCTKHVLNVVHDVLNASTGDTRRFLYVRGNV